MSTGSQRLPPEIAALIELANASMKADMDAYNERMAALLAAYDGVPAPPRTQTHKQRNSDGPHDTEKGGG